MAGLGPATSVGGLSGPTLAGWFRGRYAAAAPATWNRELATVRAAVSWWRQHGWLGADSTGDLERQRERVDRPLALQLESERNEERRRGREVVDHDAHMLHALDRHALDGSERRPQLQRLSVANRLVGTCRPFVWIDQR